MKVQLFKGGITMFRKKEKEVESDSKLNRIKKSTNITFNIIFLLISLICVIPVVFVFMISITSESSLTQYGYPKRIFE